MNSSGSREHTCKLIAVGDIMLHGRIADKIAETGDKAYPFRKVAHILQQKDAIIFGNLETMITAEKKAYPGTPGKYFSPIGTGEALKEMNFSVVNIGHNHSYDWGDEGVETTIAELDAAGIKWGGIAKRQEDAATPVFVECPACSRRFAFLFYVGTYNTLDRSHGYVGCMPRRKQLQKQVNSAKEKADIVIISIHGGACLNYWPSPDMLQWCRNAAKAGGHIVLGHHPHVPNGIESNRYGVTAFGLPDFVRPLPLSDDEVYNSMLKQEYESFVLEVGIDLSNKTSYSIHPCMLGDYLRTRSANQVEERKIRKLIDQLSQDITQGLSTQKHYQTATKDFHSIYTKSLFRQLRKGGIRWLATRTLSLRPYHFGILLRSFAKRIFGKAQK